MPSNILFMDTMFPHVEEQDGWQDAVSEILNWNYMLMEQLRYTLFNLDSSNFNEAGLAEITDPIYAQIEDAENGMKTLLQITAEGILSLVSQEYLTIEDAGDTYATITSVSSAISQSANNILLTVAANYATGAQVTSAIDVAIDSLGLSVTNSASGHYSILRLTSNGATIASSGQITLGGDVLFASNLTDGVTQISGDNILTGNINANNVTVTNAFALYDRTGYFYGYMGQGSGSDGTGTGTSGVLLQGRQEQVYMIVTESGARMTAYGNSIYVTSSGCFSTSTIVVSSDRRLKDDISHDFARYEEFFLQLKPATYRMRFEQEGKLHTGYIAQEVEAALEAAGLAKEDFAALAEIPQAGTEALPMMGLGYTEFVALNTYMIQQLWKKVAVLQAELAEMKGRA